MTNLMQAGSMIKRGKLERLMVLAVLKHQSISPSCSGLEKEPSIVLFRECNTEIEQLIKEMCDE